MKKFSGILQLAILTVIFGTIYVVTQQAQRADANYPQIQLAQDAAAALDNGQNPAQVAKGNVNITRSLAPFVVVYDKNGHAVSGSGYLKGQLPAVPLGVLSASTGKAYNAVTWEPVQGTRIAAVTVNASQYYVLSGRSLTEAEKNENKTFRLSLFGGLISLLLLGASYSLKISKG